MWSQLNIIGTVYTLLWGIQNVSKISLSWTSPLLQVHSCLYFFNAPLDNIFKYNVVQWQMNARKDNWKTFSCMERHSPCMATFISAPLYHDVIIVLLFISHRYTQSDHLPLWPSLFWCDSSLKHMFIHMRNSLSWQCISCYVKKIELKRCIKLLPTVPLPA